MYPADIPPIVLLLRGPRVRTDCRRARIQSQGHQPRAHCQGQGPPDQSTSVLVVVIGILGSPGSLRTST